VYNYQGGFDYNRALLHEKPGLTCHHLAIDAAIAAQCRRYDFLAGTAQYKDSLADTTVLLHWMETGRGYTSFSLQIYARNWLRRLKSNLSTTAEPKID
jgi:CelD/BcsL family acetyltransferase involved in cellulose biosynthesis